MAGTGSLPAADIPYGTRFLLITCGDLLSGQFGGIKKICWELKKRSGFYHFPYRSQSLFLARRRVLNWVVISGHGAKDKPEIGNGSVSKLVPDHIRLSNSAALLLLGCYQGKMGLRASWSRFTGAREVWGCSGETESVLSTLFLLHVLYGKRDRIFFWFKRWIEANNYFRPYFLEARRVYKESNGDFLLTLEAMCESVDTSPFEDFLAPARIYSAYLDGLF